MPKNAGTQSEEARQSEIAIRKKKNADAQAAFRARRANYIATLEETVTSLESVVLQLQDSCREARMEAQSLRHELSERERFWRMWSSSRKTDENAATEPNLNGQMGAMYSETISYRSPDDPSICNGQYQGYASPSLYSAEADGSPSQRKYSPYPYHVPHRNDWSTSSNGESGPHPHSTGSPRFTESPTSTLASSSELSLPFSAARFANEEQKVAVGALDAAPYVFSNSRSISPSNTASTTTPMAAPSYPFTFPDGSSVTDRPPEFDYRRTNHNGDVSLSGPGSQAVRYSLGTRRGDAGADRPGHPILPPLQSDGGSQHERTTSEGGSNHSYTRLRARRDSAIGSASRSSSPATVPPFTGTLAVIKAQAFGALRRTRARKKPTDAPKTAVGVMEARGIEMAPPAKRQRTQDLAEEGVELPTA
ncbi:BZIP domain-containing protein [Mycena kentingensis (nom. inval.)]|nr:BZIP domain-containing protein [Mycena kentingensis (nom. inval.)]